MACAHLQGFNGLSRLDRQLTKLKPQRSVEGSKVKVFTCSGVQAFGVWG